MDSLDITIALIAPTIAVLIFVITTYAQILQRLVKVETNSKMLIQWVACLNGDMSSEKEVQDFLKKLKKVAKKNILDEDL